MKKLLSIIITVLLSWGYSYSQLIEEQNSRTVIEQVGAPVTDLNLKIDLSKIQALGFKNIDELNLLGHNKPTQISAINAFSIHLNSKCYNFQYDDIFIIQSKDNADLKTINTNPRQNLELYYTIRALEILKHRYSFLYQRLVSSVVYPQIQSTDYNDFTNWYNRYPKIIISFNTGSSDVAISGTYLDPKPNKFNMNGQSMNLYENFPIISINSELIKGTNIEYGSLPIYKKSKPEENYLLYLKEGLLQSICHELLHRYIDINNIQKGSVYYYLFFGDGRKDRNSAGYDKNLYNIEEVIVNRTLDKYFRQAGGLSSDLLNYYSDVETGLLNTISNLNTYKTTLMTYKFVNQDLSLDL